MTALPGPPLPGSLPRNPGPAIPIEGLPGASPRSWPLEFSRGLCTGDVTALGAVTDLSFLSQGSSEPPLIRSSYFFLCMLPALQTWNSRGFTPHLSCGSSQTPWLPPAASALVRAPHPCCLGPGEDVSRTHYFFCDLCAVGNEVPTGEGLFEKGAHHLQGRY